MTSPDESATNRLPVSLVLRLRKRLDATERASLGVEATKICDLINGRRSVSDMLRSSGFPGFVTTRILRTLIEGGIAEPVPGQAAGVSGVAASPAPSGRTMDLTELLDERRKQSMSPVPVQRRTEPGTIQAEVASVLALEVIPPPPTVTPPPDAEPSLPPNPEQPEEPSTSSTRSQSGELQSQPEARRRNATPYVSFVKQESVSLNHDEPPVPAIGQLRNTVGYERTAAAIVPEPALAEAAPLAEPPSGLEQRIYVGPYRVVGRLAKGGVGSVYLCSRGGPFEHR